MKSTLLAILLIVSAAVPPAAGEEAPDKRQPDWLRAWLNNERPPQPVGTWQIVTAVAGNPAVWQVNTTTGEMRLCQFIQAVDGSAIACSGWIRVSEQVTQPKK